MPQQTNDKRIRTFKAYHDALAVAKDLADAAEIARVATVDEHRKSGNSDEFKATLVTYFDAYAAFRKANDAVGDAFRAGPGTEG